MQMFAEPGFFSSGYNQNTNRLAIFKAGTQDFRWVTGMPAYNAISTLGASPFFEDGKAYMPIVFTGGAEGATAPPPAVYIVDAATATASKGITVIADNGVSAIGRLHN